MKEINYIEPVICPGIIAEVPNSNQSKETMPWPAAIAAVSAAVAAAASVVMAVTSVTQATSAARQARAAEAQAAAYPI